MENPVRQDVEEFGKDMGLVHEAVVTGRKVGAGRNFWTALAHDEEKFREVVRIVLPYQATLFEGERMALEVLGKGKVLGFFQSMKDWGIEPPDAEPVFQFSRKELEECARENEGGADWRVVWINGFSLRAQEQIRGKNRKKQPCFDPDYTWWLKKEQDGWGNQSIGAGYQLLDFSGRFGILARASQENEIMNLGECFERAEEQAVSEACFSFYAATSGKERLLEGFYHWGRLSSAGGGHVCVGYFDQNGFFVHYYWDDYPYGVLRVVLSRKSSK